MRRVDMRAKTGTVPSAARPGRDAAGLSAFLTSLRIVGLCIPLLLAAWAAADAEPAFRLSLRGAQELPCPDCDGIALGDISGNGRMDILASSGKHGETFWFEQGETYRDWTRHFIHRLPPPGGEIEGNDLGDFNGDGRLEAVSLDQPNGVIYIHAPVDDPRGEWRSAAIQRERPFLQATLVTDIDGDGVADLVYSWEGNAPGRGGIHWLRCAGGDPLNPAHWTDQPLVQHESAWWIASRRADFSGDGGPGDIVFTARNMPNRNPGTRPGLFRLEAPQDPAQPWRRHVIDDTPRHPLQVDFGNLAGEGHGLDLVIGGFETDVVYWYAFKDGWKRSTLPVPTATEDNPTTRVWNVKTLRSGGPRDALLVAATGDKRGGALWCFEYVEDAYRPWKVMDFGYAHPMDDRILLYDLDGDGVDEVFIPDSGVGVNLLRILHFDRREP
ncbi:MAG TPA: VCBS repeat-containing protein [Candidatus Hydrogenedentes bacterium]|nr:VCBS repeat-containing protein [Candidatus Hydrogenedentota bacterium]